MRAVVIGVVVLAGCQAQIKVPEAQSPAAETADAVAKPDKTPKKADPAFPERETGWTTVTEDERTAIAALASDYAGFLGRAKTPRRAIAGLVELVGAQALPATASRLAPGTRFSLHAPGGRTAAFVVAGERPIEEGARIIVASVDAPRIELKQRPVYERAGFAMLDTTLYGTIDFASWLVTPLALYIYAARPGAADGAFDLAIGERDEDPVLMIPDLLPHLSYRVQRRAVIDAPERLDAVAARSERALIEYLRGRGFSADDFAVAETALVPAGQPIFLGVDRATIGGYGHAERAMAYAAVRALMALEAPRQPAIVILLSKSEGDYTGSSGEAFVRQALGRIIGALSAAGADADTLTVRRIYARSSVVVASSGSGAPGKGVVLDPATDDALPLAARHVVDALATTSAQYQYAEERGDYLARDLATLDLDTVNLGVPVRGIGTPLERISVFDLYHAERACRGWLRGGGK